MAKQAPMSQVSRDGATLAGRSKSTLAAGPTPAAKAGYIRRLHRARGQVDGVERMIIEERCCTDIITQITAARASLQAVAKAMLEAQLKSCHAAAMNNGGAATDGMYRELVALVAKMAR